MADEKFLIDTNSFIEPYNKYYSFDLAANFWEQIKQHIELGNIAILDMVKDEINKGEDDLSEWLNGVTILEEIDHRVPDIISNFSKVLQEVQDNPIYKETALENWSQETVADAWLIATAITNNYTIITFEKGQRIHNSSNTHRNAKIPDVAEVFGVKVADLYYLMRTLGIKL